MGDKEDSNPRKRCRDEITKAEEEEQTTTKKPCVTTSEGLTDDAAEQHETSNVDKLGEEQLTRKEEENISEEDEGEMRKDQEKDALSVQARGEQGDAESVKKDTSVRQTINDRHMSTDEDCEKQNKLINSEDEEVQETLFINEDSTHSSSTEENTNEKSEELKETKVDDAPVNVGEQVKHSSEQHLDEETKTERQKQTECQKPAETSSEDLTDEEKEEQGGDIGLEELKRHTSVREKSHVRHMSTDEDCEKQSKLINSGDKETLFRNEDSTHSSSTEENTNEKSEELKDTKVDDAPVNVGEQKHSSKKTNTVKQKQTVIQPQRVHYGLYNQGATCYLNSVLQVLFMTPEVHDRFNSELKTELNQIFSGLKKSTCGTEKISRILKIKNVHEQGDAAECLELILNKISQRDSKEIQGHLMYTTKCSEGHIINKETNPFWTLPLSLKDNHDTTYSVERLFQRIFQTKTFNGDNKVHCNECNNKTEATSECEMEKYPPILNLLLKRFDFDYRRMSHYKSDCCVDVPLELKTKNQTYKLYGMVNHMGSLTGGHYTATILSNEDETWYECNDSYVGKVEQLFEKGTYKSKTVYLLMYRECQKPAETSSEDLTDEVKEEQGEDIGLEEQKGQELENKNVSKRDTGDEDNTQMGHSEEDEEQMKRDQEKDALNLQARGEEGDAESVKKDTEENTIDKSEELKESKVDDDPLNVGEQSKYSSDQPLDKETKTEKQKQRQCQKPAETSSEYLTDEVKEEQGENIGLEGQKGQEVENKHISQRDTGDEENKQMGHSEENEGQMRKDQEKDALSTGEEGDAERVKKDTSVSVTIPDRNTNTGVKCATMRKETKVDDAPVNVEEELKYSSDQHLDEETKTGKRKQTECQKPAETSSEDLIDEVKEEQGKNIGLEGQKGEEVENKHVSQRDTGDEENKQMGHSEEDDGQIRKYQEKYTLSLQARGEEGYEESVKKDTETSHVRQMNTDEDFENQSKLINSGDKEVQRNNFRNEDSTHSSSTEENTNEKSEELKETKVDDAPVNVEEQLKYSSEQHLDEETKTEQQKQTECQKPAETSSEDLTDEVKEEQGGDIGLEGQKGEEVENKHISQRDTGDEENTQMGHSEEDKGKIRKDQEKDALSLQARGEEGDEESVKKYTSEHTNEKSEELKETKVDDAPVNVGEQLKYSSDQRLDEETKTEKQKQTECQKPAETSSEDLIDEVKEEQGENIGLEGQKGEEIENKHISQRDTGDEENKQMGHSEEDEGQMRKDQEKDTLSLQARGEEGDEESVKKDTSVIMS
ncbi:trichohyalin-like isoform X2 [Dicentrarchus labrax]|uniref:trichohyalin-like isoform X2 n=2 Tax=Dicentrarchus labrax TaxID=13489 RepID=UPI0021F50BFE|nr:trichohyalin-like isoform X2 [Dicentrarchus labrax]